MAKKHEISALPHYLEEVLRVSEELKNAPGDHDADGPWFRGVNDARYGLRPGSYWRKGVDEEALVVDFVAQAPQYFDSSGAYQSAPTTPWEWYFLMQHYGLPTRLLDWTENALVALFFALHPPGPRPCVWMLEPAQFNRHMIKDPFVVTPGGDFSKYWLPFASEDQKAGCHLGRPSRFKYQGRGYSNRQPMAIFAARRNARILAQQGVFTVHGSAPHPLEKILAKRPGVLARIDIKVAAAKKLLADLEICGVSEMRLFPELDKLAPALKRKFELEK